MHARTRAPRISGQALPHIGGTWYRDYFVEAPSADDLGFRMAYLEAVRTGREAGEIERRYRAVKQRYHRLPLAEPLD